MCAAIGASGTHSVGVCSIHRNAILLCSASGLKITYRYIINMIVCNSKNKHCIIHCCHECPGNNNLKNYLVENMLGLDKSEIEYSNTEINFSIWVGTDRAWVCWSLSHHSRWYNRSQLHFKSLKYIFNESKRKSWLWHLYCNARFCWKLSVCFTKWNSVVSLE